MLLEWAHNHLPAILHRKTPLGAEYWQLLQVPVVIAAAYVLARLFGALLTRLAMRLAKLTTAELDDLMISAMRSPMVLLLTGIFGLVLTSYLELPERAHNKVNAIFHMVAVLAGFWALLRSVDIVHHYLRAGAFMVVRPTAVPVLTLLMRIAKVGIVTLGGITAMQLLGYPVAGLLAGLGVGGLAVALAAQKTLENLLGSVMLTVDQPMRVGDLITVDTVTGEVEQIGLRSTWLRTPARTLVSIPNGKLADARIENFSARERLQLNFTLGLDYATKPETVRAIVDDMRALLKAHPQVWKDGAFVHLSELGESNLRLEISTWLEMLPIEEFRDARQALYLSLLQVVHTHGARFAFPTRTIHLVDERQEST